MDEEDLTTGTSSVNEENQKPGAARGGSRRSKSHEKKLAVRLDWKGTYLQV